MVQGIASIGANQTQPQPQVPPEVASSVNKGFNSLTQDEVSKLRELTDDLKDLSPDKLRVLEQIITFLKRNSNRYDDAVKLLVEKGVVEPGDLPPHYIPVFFEILDNVVNQALAGGPKKFAKGGIAALRKQAENVRQAGTGGDKMLAHINPKEAAMLAATRGGGMNPSTGLPEFGFFDDVGNFLKQASGVILPVALGFMGVPPIIAGAVGSGVGAMINGATPGQAIQSALLGGLGGAAFSGVNSMMNGGSFGEGLAAGFQPATQGPLSGFFGGQQAAPLQPATPSSLGTDYTPAQISGQMGRGVQTAANPSGGFLGGIGNWIQKNPLPALGIAGLGGAALGSAMSSGQGSTTVNFPTGPSAAQVAAARFPAGSLTPRTPPSINVVPTYSPNPAYANFNPGQYPNQGQSPMFYAAQGGELDARIGGHLHGPGTGTSDSIPAKLSDGEFVMTAKAVRGAGDGSREKGAKKMYQLMHQFEKRA